MRASDVDKQRRFGKLPATMRRLANISGITFLLFVAWKVALLVFTAQPVPSNDSFFYDGPVVNYLLHGRYCNPSLTMVMPIAGQEVFAAYPPLYQAVLLGWMRCFGTSVLAAMWLHMVLITLFTLTTLRILRQLQLSARSVNLAGLFLFGITFHDRPDTLAHVLGALALLGVVRGLIWPAAALLLLTFATSLQIGAIYSLWIGLLLVGAAGLRSARFPWAAAAVLACAIVALVALVRFGHPQLWAGFQEHLRITPSITGLRMPRLDDLLKVTRTSPGIALAMLGLGWMAMRGGLQRVNSIRSLPFLVALSGALTTLILIVGCLVLLTPNTIHIAGYLQPIIVGSFLAVWLQSEPNPRWWQWLLLLAATLLVWVRAIGMTTWGVICSRDVSCAMARQSVTAEFDAVPPGSTVFVSSAFLYDAAQRTNVTWLHSDWPAPAAGPDWERHALENLRPAKLILTQFDYYRRYAPVLADLHQSHPEFGIQIRNLAHIAPPDASPQLQKVVQHISWAPVVVDFHWPEPVK